MTKQELLEKLKQLLKQAQGKQETAALQPSQRTAVLAPWLLRKR